MPTRPAQNPAVHSRTALESWAHAASRTWQPQVNARTLHLLSPGHGRQALHADARGVRTPLAPISMSHSALHDCSTHFDASVTKRKWKVEQEAGLIRRRGGSGPPVRRPRRESSFDSRPDRAARSRNRTNRPYRMLALRPPPWRTDEPALSSDRNTALRAHPCTPSANPLLTSVSQ
jgi:hypothetical protein